MKIYSEAAKTYQLFFHSIGALHRRHIKPFLARNAKIVENFAQFTAFSTNWRKNARKKALTNAAERGIIFLARWV